MHIAAGHKYQVFLLGLRYIGFRVNGQASLAAQR